MLLKDIPKRDQNNGAMIISGLGLATTAGEKVE
jgi:hypothetical protein